MPNRYEELVAELGIITESANRIMPILQNMDNEELDNMLSAHNKILDGISDFLKQLNHVPEGHNH